MEFRKAARPEDDRRLTAAAVSNARPPVRQVAAPPDWRAAQLLTLQRAIGNRAVCHLIEGQSSLAQRKVGFEAEYSVHTIGPPPAATSAGFQPGERKKLLGVGPKLGKRRAPAPAIEQFLLGGLKYGDDRGSNTFYTLKPDHGSPDTDPVLNKLEDMGLVQAGVSYTTNSLYSPKGTTNLEYVTEAVDELAPGSTKQFDEQINAIVAHARQVWNAANANAVTALPSPATNTYTGVPRKELTDWLGSRSAELGPALAKFNGSLENEFYVQATVGVRPSALPALFTERKRPKDDRPRYEDDMIAAIVTTVETLYKTPDFAEDEWVEKLRDDRPVTYQSLRGAIYFMAQYIIGSALNQTTWASGSDKNAVIFLSKMTNMGDLLNKAGTNYWKKYAPPDHVIDYIDKYLFGRPEAKPEYWTKKFKKLRRNARKPIIGSSFVQDFLHGGDVDAVGTGADRTFDKPDTLPSEVSKAAFGEQGFQFEYRDITARPGPDGLGKVFWEVIDEVRNLNLAHLDDDDQQKIVDAANSG